MINFIVPAIRGKGRPRMTKKGHCYTPKETVQFENLVKQCFIAAGGQMIQGPVELSVTAYFTRPKSHYKAGKMSHLLKENAPVYHTGKPDADNIIKAIADSLNKLAYPDDSNIANVSCMKIYTNNIECCEVWLEALK